MVGCTGGAVLQRRNVYISSRVVALALLLGCGEPTDVDNVGDPGFEVQEPSSADDPHCQFEGGEWSCPFDCTNADDWPDQWHQRAQRLVDAVNERRQAPAECNGEALESAGSVEMDESLVEAARCHALDMGENRFFSHEGSDGSFEVDRANDAGFSGAYVGENLAAGIRDVDAVVDAWIESEGHCINLMHAPYRETGVAFVDIGGERFWVQKYGRAPQ